MYQLCVPEDRLGEGVLRDDGPPALAELDEVDPPAGVGEGFAERRFFSTPSPGTPVEVPLATGVGESVHRCSKEFGCLASM